MARTGYPYSISVDFVGLSVPGEVDVTVLTAEVGASAIVEPLEDIIINDDTLTFYFSNALTGGDQTILDGIVAAHTGLGGKDKQPLLAEEWLDPVLVVGTAHTIDLSLGRLHIIDLENATGDVTLTLNNPQNGIAYGIRAIQGPIARQFIWPGNVDWPAGVTPENTPVNNAEDQYQLIYDGTNFKGVYSYNFS